MRAPRAAALAILSADIVSVQNSHLDRFHVKEAMARAAEDINAGRYLARCVRVRSLRARLRACCKGSDERLSGGMGASGRRQGTPKEGLCAMREHVRGRRSVCVGGRAAAAVLITVAAAIPASLSGLFDLAPGLLPRTSAYA
jgi:hypothetical protein